MGRYRFSIDWGETFTDFALVDEEGNLFIKKLPSNFRDPTNRLIEEIVAFLRQYATQPNDIQALITGLNVDMEPNRAVNCIRELEDYFRRLGWRGKAWMAGVDGTVFSMSEAYEDPEMTLNTGWVGSAAAGRFYGSLTGKSKRITFRMGGTFTYLSVLKDPELNPDVLEVATSGKRLMLGGNHYVGVLEDGSVGVLPDTADYAKGPVSFGRGNWRPTLTDADLILGLLNPDYFLGGMIPLDLKAAFQSVQRLVAQPLGIRVEEAAMLMSQAIEDKVAQTIRASVGPLDTMSEYELLAFGGTGPVHAIGLATQLGIKKVTIPVGAGVAAALGYLVLLAEQYPEGGFNEQLTFRRQSTRYRVGEGDFSALKSYRSVYYDADLTPCACPVYDRSRIRPQDTLSGPGIIEEPETTVVIRYKNYVHMDPDRNLFVSLR